MKRTSKLLNPKNLVKDGLPPIKIIVVLSCFIIGIQGTSAQLGKLQAMEEELLFVSQAAGQMWDHISCANFDFDGYFEQYTTMAGLLCRQFDGMLNQVLTEDKEMVYLFKGLLDKKGYKGILETNAVWSADSLLRVFSWSLPGGTMHYYGNALQYKNGNRDAAAFSFDNPYNRDYEVESTGFSYDTVYMLSTKDKIIYVLSGSTQFSTRVIGFQLTAFSIGDDGLGIVNIFEDENGNPSHQLEIAYDITVSRGHLPADGFARMAIDETEGMLLVPVVEENRFTGKYIRCKFNGGKFNRITKPK